MNKTTAGELGWELTTWVYLSLIDALLYYPDVQMMGPGRAGDRARSKLLSRRGGARLFEREAARVNKPPQGAAQSNKR